MGGLARIAWPYKYMSRKLIPLWVVLTIFILAVSGSASPGRTQAGDPSALIDAVNNLRVANGLPAYQENSILMSIAQGHSDYMAAIGQVTHIGAGGTHPRDRAASAGYGGGATFFISENIAGGTDLSVDGAISMWLGDDPHIQTMLGPNYQEIGAGVAVAGGFVYYTIDAAYVAGGSYSPSVSITPGGPTAIPIYAVQTSTPYPDGSIWHLVRYGQFLYNIAKAYGVSVQQIMDLNGLTSDKIYEGQKLLIQRAGTPAPTSTVTATSTPTQAATPTRKPTRTPTPSATPAPTTTEAAPLPRASKNNVGNGSDPVGKIFVIAILGLAGGGVILMVAGSLIRRRAKPAGG